MMNVQSNDTESLVDSNNDETSDNQSGSLGFFAVVFLTVNATLGAGLLNIPYAFDESGGIFFASIFQTIHLFLVIFSLMILSYCTQICNVDSLQKLVLQTCGSKCSIVCSICIILYSYGACVTYIIIIGDQFDKIFEAVFGPTYTDHWFMNRDFLMLSISVITILPLCISKDISFLKFASFLGFLSTLYLTILVMVEYLKLNSKSISVKTRPDRWTEVFNIVPVLSFSYQCQLSWVPTYSQIKNKTNYSHVFGMIFVSMLICFISYTWTAALGLFTFGSLNIRKDMMQNYDPKDLIVSFGMLLLIVKTIVVYPILLFCGRIVVEQYINNLRSQLGMQTSCITETIVRISTATFWVLTSCALAIFVPNISVAINYLGSLANFFVFIFPGLILYCIMFNDELLYKLQNESKIFTSNTLILLSLFLIAYGVFAFTLSLIQSILNTVR